MKEPSHNLTFIVGNPYFKVSYYDKKLSFPKIETVVFIGTGRELKARSDAMNDFFYFQDAHSYVEHGLLFGGSDDVDDDDYVIIAIEERDAVLLITEVGGLMEKLNRRFEGPK